VYIIINIFVALYFFRIILVFILCWFPGMLLFCLSYTGPNNDNAAWASTSASDSSSSVNPVYYSAGLLLCSVQPILSTLMALTKSDVKKAVVDLITLNYH